jgi:transcriptional regulator with XRE-family HTH domain
MGGVFVFYDRYAQLCKQKGVSMSAAAEEAGFAKSLVSKWKKLKIEVPSPEILQKLSAYFGMTIAELLGEGKKENPTSPKADEVDEVTMELLDIIQNGTNEDRQDLLEMYRIIKKRRETR